MKQKIAKFFLFLHTTHVIEDWSLISKTGKIILYPFWFIRAIIIYTLFFLYIPEYLFKQSKLYQVYLDFASGKKTFEDLHKANIENKINTNNFLNNKYNSGKFTSKVSKPKKIN